VLTTTTQPLWTVLKYFASSVGLVRISYGNSVLVSVTTRYRSKTK